MGTQWIQCHGEERHGGEKACGDGCTGQGTLWVGDQSASSN